MPTGIRFPVELPPPNRDDYGTTFEETRSQQEKEIGAARQRREYSIEPRIENLSWLFTQTQYTIFDSWWQNSIKSGELEFDIQISDDDAGLIWYTAKWIESYQTSIDSQRYEWVVSGKLRLLGESFATRLSGTDELIGKSLLVCSAKGQMSVDKTLRGYSGFINVAKARFSQGSLTGAAAFMVITATGEFGPLPLRGSSLMVMTASGNGTNFGVKTDFFPYIWMGMEFIRGRDNGISLRGGDDEGFRRSFMRIGNHGIRRSGL
ncbi:MAG: hypothetical protein V4493_01330 [Pseudomonadota bacterium]